MFLFMRPQTIKLLNPWLMVTTKSSPFFDPDLTGVTPRGNITERNPDLAPDLNWLVYHRLITRASGRYQRTITSISRPPRPPSSLQW
jgi:hypothetical protein